MIDIDAVILCQLYAVFEWMAFVDVCVRMSAIDCCSWLCGHLHLWINCVCETTSK